MQAPKTMNRLNRTVIVVFITLVLGGIVAFARGARTVAIDPIPWTWGVPGLGVAIVLTLAKRRAGSMPGAKQVNHPLLGYALIFGLFLPLCSWAFAALADRQLDSGWMGVSAQDSGSTESPAAKASENSSQSRTSSSASAQRG